MIFISIERQKLYLIKDEKIVKEYQISTSKYGKGNELGSEKTPTGIHRIYKKIGGGMPEDTYFIGRIPYSKQEAEKKFGQIKDKITARVIWLEGCEEGINKGKNEEGKIIDTKERFIYIHGTPDDISTPSSRGCIRMSNKDIIELFELVEEGELVIIF